MSQLCIKQAIKRKWSHREEDDKDSTDSRRKSARLQAQATKKSPRHSTALIQSSKPLLPVTKAKDSSPSQLKSKVKRKRTISACDKRDTFAKKAKIEHAQDHEESLSRTAFTTCWLNNSSDTLADALSEMSRHRRTALPSPKDSFDDVSSKKSTSTSMTKRTDRSKVSVNDSDYRTSTLHKRHVYIDEFDPPPELVRRAQRIMSRPRVTPEMDDRQVEEIRRKVRSLENVNEADLEQQLAPDLIPSMYKLPDERLARSAKQVWTNMVPLPLDADLLKPPPPMPNPAPDLCLGYGPKAFNRKQQAAIELLVDDPFGQSYAVPEPQIRFPFLAIEFKSQAKKGTHYVATNQAAGAGSLALNGHSELIRRSFGEEGFDYNEPQFFSVTMDHEFARINVHWLKRSTGGSQQSFHVENLKGHFLKDPAAIRALSKAIKNIIDYNLDERLEQLTAALDRYRAKIITEAQVSSNREERLDRSLRDEAQISLGSEIRHNRNIRDRAQIPPSSETRNNRTLRDEALLPPSFAEHPNQSFRDEGQLRSISEKRHNRSLRDRAQVLPGSEKRFDQIIPGGDLRRGIHQISTDTALMSREMTSDDEEASIAELIREKNEIGLIQRDTDVAGVRRGTRLRTRTRKVEENVDSMEVQTKKIKVNDQLGLALEHNGRQVFIAYENWETVIKMGRRALFNKTLNVHCFTD